MSAGAHPGQGPPALGSLDLVASLGPGQPAAPELLRPGSRWRLAAPLDLRSSPRGAGLATQAAAGRCLQVLQAPGDCGSPVPGRLRVRLLEDGYPGWLAAEELLGIAFASGPHRPRLLAAPAIAARLPHVLAFAEAARRRPNRYLWGGSLGPDFDCSGLLQTAFAAAGIWIPRDAYQQERFCQSVAVRPGHYALLRPGDLIFFGSPQRCSHVGLYLGQGRYLHSSGREHGRDGLGIDSLDPQVGDPVSVHYRLELRGAGRVVRCHDGTPLP
ncbi:C40 family peptidase [Vulcanococcus limneticus Candia 3F8]|nr:C40 family peptidase [Vulcanococcus limneticus MW73D5]MCP9893024.1 C40 family peptidase [Vulcanococcus limneticus Candia 3F8]MCP9896838.1 C40 family peptidase [Vulcanococcus limneticus Candia 3B3]